MVNVITITEHDVVYAGGDKKIHYLAAGPVNGPLIVFVHGWPATAITWKAQIDAFAALGFRAIAPDMPGYGKSTARKVRDDYCLEAIVEGLMALLGDTGRSAAIWVGHDWGSGATSSVATQHPEAVKALVSISVPFSTLELGWDRFLPLVNRELYPADQYPYGQWDYFKHYEENFERAVSWFEQDIAGFCKVVLQPASEAPSNRFCKSTATARKDGGWFGLAKPPSPSVLGPTVMEPEVFESFLADMQKTGFWPGCAYYTHNERNAEYNGKAKSGGRLTQPAMFVHAAWDVVCDTKTSRLIEPMREVCSNLTEVTIETNHFAQNQKPGELNAAIIRFIIEELPTEWPGFWNNGYTKSKTAS
ncbi:putative epoxide hydrolase [Xylaria sp. CBS 124048]|nr:putative epoxide hydrolase [Xylaria sp. CBS 124048]